MLRIKKTLLLTIVSIALGVLITGCGGGNQPEQEKSETKEAFKIGVVLDISGPASSLGVPERDSIKLIEKQLNAQGGINGNPVEFIIRDNESDESKGVMAVKDLIEKEKVLAIVGSSTSGTSMAMVPTATSAGVPMVSAAASIKIIEPVAERKWIFKTANNDSHVATKIIEHLKSKGISKVAFMLQDNAYGDSGKKEFSKVAKEQGITIVAEEKFGAQDKDMTPQLTRIKGKGKEVEAVVIWAIPPSASIVTANFKQLGLGMPLYHSHGIGNKKFIELAGGAANGVLFPTGKLLIANDLPDSDPQKALLLDYVKAYKAEYNAAPSTFGGHAWDGMQVVLEALKKSGGDRAKLRDELENTKGFVGITGIFDMSANDHNGLSTKDLVIVEIVNGQWKLAK